VKLCRKKFSHKAAWLKNWGEDNHSTSAFTNQFLQISGGGKRISGIKKRKKENKKSLQAG